MKIPKEPETAALALMQLARKTGDRYRDISDSLRSKVLSSLGVRDVPASFANSSPKAGNWRKVSNR